uniref:Uncharacterized protein n=1 Tax=Monopterus albus TaxID=43700 RepID=A0A3Q3KBH1_MONAL
MTHTCFNSTSTKGPAVQISGSPLYNQVAFFSSASDHVFSWNNKKGFKDDYDKFKMKMNLKDPKVNLMSLTILGLRLLFLKTIVFNVLMTLRLWFSQCEYKHC